MKGIDFGFEMVSSIIRVPSFIGWRNVPSFTNIVGRLKSHGLVCLLALSLKRV